MRFLRITAVLLFAVAVSLGNADAAAHMIQSVSDGTDTGCHEAQDHQNPDVSSGQSDLPEHDCSNCICCLGVQTIIRPFGCTAKLREPFQYLLIFADSGLHFREPAFFLLRPPTGTV